jgi:CheY-like chemotaxis protein
LGLLVEALGHQAHVTYGGTRALDVATTFRPDLMLVDLVMPDLDGCSLVKRFRQNPTFAHTKIVAITAHADEGHKTLAIKAGFDTVLFKPVVLTEIEAVLVSVVPNVTFTTLHKAARRLLVSANARKLLDATVQLHMRRKKRVKSSSIDSTGLECSAASAYFVKRRTRVGGLWKKVAYHYYANGRNTSTSGQGPRPTLKLGLVCDTSRHFILACVSGGSIATRASFANDRRRWLRLGAESQLCP